MAIHLCTKHICVVATPTKPFSCSVHGLLNGSAPQPSDSWSHPSSFISLIPSTCKPPVMSKCTFNSLCPVLCTTCPNPGNSTS